MILRRLYPAIIILPIHHAFAYPHQSPQTLPASVATIPDCAQPCVSDFVKRSYPPGVVCDTQKDLTCLCSTATTTGLTLDEGAAVCIEKHCPTSESQTQGLALICGNKKRALSSTRSAPTPLTSTSIAAPSTTEPGKSISTTASQSQSPLQTQMPSTGPAATNGSSVGLTGAQIAGITIGIVAAAVLGISIVLMARFSRRRKELERRRTLKISRPMPIGWGGEHNARSVGAIAGPVRPVPMATIARKSFSDWTMPDSPGGEDVDIGIVMTPGTAQSIGTDGRSIRTTSMLLPVRPAILLQPAPRPGNTRLERGRPSSTATEFEDVD
ncbi:MAG: hypothetical protein M1839_001810 [Geoglossum umbratile]|nr:MAG: hypothetical protein M1839_001810 [Geoglossum umbratile]